jgi:phenylpropionate dioxygenase-like ring-hydroxylating dioxygenase large terminal subunit
MAVEIQNVPAKQSAAGYTGYVQETPDYEFKVRASVYTDPAVFADEMRLIFESTWVYVGHESEIPKPGDFKTAAIGRLPVIVSRDQDRKINVMLNICRHRAAAVCNEERGNTRYFHCPYHQWTYGMDGKLAAMSDEEGYPAGWRERIGGLLHAACVSIYHGMIFARMTAQGESLEEYLGPIKKHVDLWFSQSPTSSIKVLPPTITRYPANWKFQVENTTDGWHARYVHASAFKILEEQGMRDRKRGLVGCARAGGYGHGVLDRPLRRFFSGDIMDRYRNTLAEQYGKERAARVAEYGGQITLFPTLHLMEHRFRVVQPVSVAETLVYEYPVLFDGVPEEVNLEIKERFTQEGGSMVGGFINTDDIEIFARAQIALNAGHYLEYLDMSRGMAVEREEPDGERISEAAHELTQRSIYREWARLMTTDRR